MAGPQTAAAQIDFTQPPPVPIDFSQPPAASALDQFAARLPGSADTGLQGAVHHLGDTYNAVIKPLADVSAPGIARELYKKFTGQANELKELPGRMVLQFALMGEDGEGLEAGAAPEAGVRTAAAVPKPAAPITEETAALADRVKDVLVRRAGHIPGVQLAKDLKDIFLPEPAEAPTPKPNVPDNWGKGVHGTPVDQWGQRVPVAAKTLPEAFQPLPAKPPAVPGTADAPFQGPSAVRPSPDLPAAFQPLPAKAPAVPGTVDAPFQAPERPRTLADLSGDTPATPAPKVKPSILQKQLEDALGGKPLDKTAPIYNRAKPLTNLQQQIAESAEKPKTTPKAPLTNLQKQIADAANPLPQGFTATPDSSLLKGYRYDAAKQEFSAVLNNGESYVHGEVTPDQVKAFEDAESQGSAWTKKIKQGPGTVLVKKNGVPVKKVQSSGPLEDQLTDMLKQVQSGKKLSDLAAN